MEATKRRYIDWWNHQGVILNMWEHFQEGVVAHDDIIPPPPPNQCSHLCSLHVSLFLPCKYGFICAIFLDYICIY